MVEVGQADVRLDVNKAVRRRTWLVRIFPRWVRNRELALGCAIIAIIALAGIFAPLITRYTPTGQDINAVLASSSWSHPLGTDALGRDIWSRLVYSIRTDLPVAFISVVAPFVIGSLLGLIAGYYGSIVDSVLMRIGEVVLSFPFMVLVIAFVFVFGSGVLSVLIAFTVVGWISYTLIVRGEVLTEKQEEYILAARTLGYSDKRILLRHLLPNVITQAVVYSMSDIVMTITSIVGLGFLGLGIRPPTPEWGSMISDGTPYVGSHWLIAGAPGIAVIITGIGLSLIGDGLAERMRVD